MIFFDDKEFKVKQLVYRCKTLITIKTKSFYGKTSPVPPEAYKKPI